MLCASFNREFWGIQAYNTRCLMVAFPSTSDNPEQTDDTALIDVGQIYLDVALGLALSNFQPSEDDKGTSNNNI